jgi:hopene-associated glycosyltransferase HpnB
MTTLALALFSCCIWAYLLCARGGFWRGAQRDDAQAPSESEDAPWPRVVAVMPARDEAEVIGASVGSLLRQDYRGRLTVIVVDDHSSDGTAAAACRAAAEGNASDRVTVLAAPSLPDGWTGKLWAVHHGVSQALSGSDPPDYLLLTDADIHYAEDTLTDLVRRGVGGRLLLTSLMARLHCQSFSERALIPAFVFFFQMLYPFAWVNRAERRMAAAAGGCMLVQRRALQAAGGIEAIRGELIDDCALARLLKPHGPIWLGLSVRVRSIRANASLSEIRRMVVRSAYAQLRFSPWLLAGTSAAMAVTYLAPPALAVLSSGAPQLLGALAWALMALALQPTLRLYALSPAWGLALPAIAAAYMAFTLDSAYQHLRGRGGAWKGRIHRPAPARAATGPGR